MFQLKNEVIRNNIVNAVSLKMFGSIISVKSYRNLKTAIYSFLSESIKNFDHKYPNFDSEISCKEKNDEKYNL